MVKIAQRYLDVDPWKLIETGYHQERHVVSESLFSLANEYMGIRGFFDEGYMGQTLIGTYYNGIYETPKNIQRSSYKGITEKQHYMVNSGNTMYMRIYINDQPYTFDPDQVSDYERILDFKTGLSQRSYVVKDLFKITFKRILNMQKHALSHQVVTIEPLNYKGKIVIDFGIDFDVKHWNRPGQWTILNKDTRHILAKTTTNQHVYNQFKLQSNIEYESKFQLLDKRIIESVSFNLDEKIIFKKDIVGLIDKTGDKTYEVYKKEAEQLFAGQSFEQTLQDNKEFYQAFWETNDIEIKGDDLNQQGIRYCLFQLLNTYHGVDETNNIGAKGLTGEAYSGHAFWDSETYCLPFYLFTNKKAAKNLLMFRYNTLEQAKLRAKELDCIGACYPIATLNGDEASDLWQHASLQFQPTTAVFYAIWHYVKNTGDTEFLIDYGFEMMVEIARFLSSRGQYNQDGTKFGYYGVMGPDEFQMMVNHNAYTNLMGKKALAYFLELYETYQDHPKIKSVLKKTNFDTSELEVYQEQVDKMFIPYDDETKLFEQHIGFFDLPHINVHDIPVTDFPLYSHWSYDRIYRNDLIKQPDVLMFMYLYNQSFTLEQKKANYDYYEPKTIHESSLSPSVHSILASELGYDDAALNFFGFASRLDIDDYNRNTNEGLHMTSIAAAWVTIVYGFGGLRSDGPLLKIAPKLPKTWGAYTFNIHYMDTSIKVAVTKDDVTFTLDKDLEVPIIIYDKAHQLKQGKVVVKHALAH